MAFRRLILCSVVGLLSQVAFGQQLLFQSGFESATNLGTVQCCYSQLLTGADATSGYSWNNWPFNGSTPIELHLEPGGGTTGEFFNAIDTSVAHSGTRSLHLKISGAPSSCCPQVPLQSSGYPIKSVYYRAWQFFGTSEQTFLNGNTSFYYHMGTEYKSSNDFRSQLSFNTIINTHSLQPHMQSDMGGINCSNNSANACNWIDPITGATVHDQSVNRHYVDLDNRVINIPFGQWFLVETYWKRSKGPDGVFATALNGQTIGYATGPTYGNLGEELQDAYWFNLYHNTTNPDGEEWIDDLELWDSPPCGQFPCGSGSTTTWTGAVPPYMSNPPGVVGTVGVPMSIPVISTGSPTNFFMSGGLPSGLSINSSSGVISGTPTAAGTTRTYVEATNSVGKGAMWLEFQINNSATSPPTISSLSANASSITAGQWSQLQWAQSGATTLTLNPGNINVTGQDPFPVSPATTTTYTLTATNTIGTASRQVTVTVVGGAISRTLGPEPGIQFSNPPTTPFCQYGEYQRVPTSALGGNCANFLKTYDIFPTLYGPTAPTQSIPANVVDQYAIKVIWTDNNTYNGFINLGSSTGMNIADVNYQNYYWGNYTQNVTVPNFQNKTGTTVTPSNPLYISGDAWFATYSVWGADVNGVSRGPVTWAPGYPQNATAWSLGWQAFFTAAKNLAPNIRVVPHIGSQDPVVWTNFHTIFADCPGLQKEHFPLSEPVSSSSLRLQVYNQILAFYWFANVATPVFPNIATEPRTRMTQWGMDIDQTVSTQLHTALGMYALSRGTNSFFDLITTGSTTADPNLWLPTAQALGTVSSAGAPQVTVIAPNHVVGDGFNLITRQYPGGIVYYNMTGVVQHPVPPLGAKDWVGNPVTSLTLADGQGEVLLTGAAPPPLAQKSIIGAIMNGAIVQ